MLQTLYVVPHWFVAGPLFWLWAGLSIVALIWNLKQRKFGEVLGSVLPMAIGGLLVIRFVIPQVEVLGLNPADPDGALVPIGLAIRGYGLFLMMGILAGISACLVRASEVGIRPEKIIALCFWLVVVGLVGARMFYVVQKWDTYRGESGMQLLLKLLDMTEGGLVVYGSLFGALLAWAVFCWWHKLSMLQVADIIAPGMLVGLCLGRIGCLMNGCCYGEVCSVDALGMRFPAGSAPYYRHLETGELLGMQLERTTAETARGPAAPRRVRTVAPGSLAERYGIEVGDEIAGFGIPADLYMRGIKQAGLKIEAPAHANLAIEVVDKPLVVIPIRELPDRSLPIHATQIYSAIDALLLAGLLWLYFPFRRAHGELLAGMLILYSISRFLMEEIRGDELGVWGTRFSISQWVAMFVLPLGVVVFFALKWAAQRGIRGVRVER